MKYLIFSLSFLAVLFSGCIGDDVILDTVPERVGITNPINSLALDTHFQFNASYFNAVGVAVSETVAWTSSEPSIIEITSAGLATGKALGVLILRPK